MSKVRRGDVLHGVVLVDKPTDLSSQAVVTRVKAALNAQKAGHTGTLDPFAEGLMMVCLGAATRLSSALLDADKRYIAQLCLGIETTTGDTEGSAVDPLASADAPTFSTPFPFEFDNEPPLPADDPSQGSFLTLPLPRAANQQADAFEARRGNLDHAVTADEVAEILADFQGKISQVPPMYSALKHQGKPLYHYARIGQNIEREPRWVNILGLNLLQLGAYNSALATQILTLEVHCSKGTYVRTLAQDIGRALGCGAHLRTLRRTYIGDFQVSNAVTLSALSAAAHQNLSDCRKRYIKAPDSLILDWPRVQLDAEEMQRFVRGIQLPMALDVGRYRVYGPEHTPWLGVADVANGCLQPRHVVAPMTTA